MNFFNFQNLFFHINIRILLIPKLKFKKFFRSNEFPIYITEWQLEIKMNYDYLTF